MTSPPPRLTRTAAPQSQLQYTLVRVTVSTLPMLATMTNALGTHSTPTHLQHLSTRQRLLTRSTRATLASMVHASAPTTSLLAPVALPPQAVLTFAPRSTI